MKQLFFILILSFLIHIEGNSQIDNQLSFNYIHQQVESKLLGEDVNVVISLPEDYDQSDSNYPVVYILDGKWFFAQGVSSQIHFSRFKMTPNLIIVGIENAVKQRNWYTKNARIFNQFLELELIPTINKNYRTTEDRLLFGWEISGGFVIDVLGATPHLFTGYLAASPGPLDNTFMDIYQYRYDAINSLLKSNKTLNKFLFFTTGQSDYPAQYGVDNLLALLQKNSVKNFQWTYKKLVEETHATSAFKTIHKGIELYFKYYPILRFSSIEDYISKGEYEYLESYYADRKVKYNFSEEKNTKDYLYSCKSIVFTAMSNENYDAFDRYIKAFIPKNMLSITHHNHASMFASYYLKNNNTEMAINLMTHYIDNFPEIARPYNVLGNVYKQMKDKQTAKSYYQKAIQLGTKNGDRRLREYENNLILLLH